MVWLLYIQSLMLQSLMVFLWYQLDCEVATIIVISIYLGRICGSERVSNLLKMIQ